MTKEDDITEGENPDIFRFKWICADAETIDDVIAILNSLAEHFQVLKEEGCTIGGSPEDDHMEIIYP